MPPTRLSRRRFLKRAACAVTGAAWAAAAGAHAGAAAPAAAGADAPGDAGAAPPNLVLILVDDLGWKDLGCYGNTFIDTPNIDRLAARGMRFTDAYAAAPVCSPTRASLMTGQAPARVGIWEVINLNKWGQRPFGKMLQPPLRDALPAETVTLPEALKAVGYVSACIGKWHLGPSPLEHGFAAVPMKGRATGIPADLARDVEMFARHATAKQAGPWTAAAVRFIARHAGPPADAAQAPAAARARAASVAASASAPDAPRRQPFFLYLCHKAVHAPLEAPADLVEKYRAKADRDGVADIHPAYAAMVEMVDRSVGLVLRTLDALRLAERTLVVLFSDNGGLVRDMHFDCPLVTTNAPLRSHKGDVYEGGIRVPLVVRWPGAVRPGTVCGTPVISHDLCPTLVEAAGAGLPAGAAMDGVSLVPLLRETGDFPREALYWHFPTCSYDRHPMGAVRRGDFKLIEHYETGRVELYNLRDDIGEQRDLASAMPEQAAALRRDLARWRDAVGARMPAPNPKYDPERAHLLPADVGAAPPELH